MVFTVESQKNSQSAEGLKHHKALFGLRHRRSQVKFAGHKQQRLHVPNVHKRTVVELLLEIGPKIAVVSMVIPLHDIRRAGNASAKRAARKRRDLCMVRSLSCNTQHS